MFFFYYSLLTVNKPDISQIIILQHLAVSVCFNQKQVSIDWIGIGQLKCIECDKCCVQQFTHLHLSPHNLHVHGIMHCLFDVIYGCHYWCFGLSP